MLFNFWQVEKTQSEWIHSSSISSICFLSLHNGHLLVSITMKGITRSTIWCVTAIHLTTWHKSPDTATATTFSLESELIHYLWRIMVLYLHLVSTSLLTKWIWCWLTPADLWQGFSFLYIHSWTVMSNSPFPVPLVSLVMYVKWGGGVTQTM